jgi:hypothetical protein
VNLQAYARIAYGALLLTCIGYTFVNKDVGAIAVELTIVVWTTGRILVEAIEALEETGKK